MTIAQRGVGGSGSSLFAFLQHGFDALLGVVRGKHLLIEAASFPLASSGAAEKMRQTVNFVNFTSARRPFSKAKRAA